MGGGSVLSRRYVVFCPPLAVASVCPFVCEETPLPVCLSVYRALNEGGK